MRSHCVIAVDVLPKQAAMMQFVEHDHVGQTFSSQRLTTVETLAPASGASLAARWAGN